MSKRSAKLKNVTLHRTLTRGGDDTWMLIHDDGWRDPFFDQYADYLLRKMKRQFNTREKYCRHVAAFVDYLVEAAKWYREKGGGDDLSGEMLVELVEIYPKVLAGGGNSRDPIVHELATRLGRSASKPKSQIVHVAAINHYLELSESFNIRMRSFFREGGKGIVLGSPSIKLNLKGSVSE